MPTVTTKDGVEIFYKDWGSGQPIVFSHGWPLSADDWDAQMLFFVSKGYRAIAHDRRGHGRSSQTGEGHDMDHYADDLAALTAHLDLKDAVHVGHSTGGGEVVHYIARHGEGRVAKAAIIAAVPPLMVRTDANPGGLPKEVFDGFQAQLAANRAQFYYDIPAGPFYGYNRPGAKSDQGVIWNWWRQGMMGGAKAHYDGIVAFSQTDFTDDLKKIAVPVLVIVGDDDQIVPYAEFRAAIGKAAEKRHSQNLSGLSSRHAYHARGDNQHRSAGIHQRDKVRLAVAATSRCSCNGTVQFWAVRKARSFTTSRTIVRAAWRRLRLLLRASAHRQDRRQSGGSPKEVFDGCQAQLAANRVQFYSTVRRCNWELVRIRSPSGSSILRRART